MKLSFPNALGALGLSLSLLMTPMVALAQSQTPAFRIAQQTASPALQQANQLLESLRREWAQRDPNASGPAFAEQAMALERKVVDLIARYEQVLAADPGNIEARVNLAEVHFVFLSRFDEAEKLLQQALATDPTSPKALIAMAEFQFFFKGEREAALKSIEQALQARPGHPDLTITLADLLTGSSNKPEDFARARGLLEQALAAQPNQGDLRYMLASVWYREAQLDPKAFDQAKAQTALDLYRAQLAAHSEPDLVVETAQVALAMGQPAVAREIVEQGIKAHPGEPHLRLQLADLWLAQGSAALDAGQVPPEAAQAEAIYRALMVPAEFNRLVSAQQVQLFYNLGLLAYLRGQQAKATPSQALPHYLESERMYRQAMGIFDRINIINSPLQQDLARTLEALGAIQETQAGVTRAADYYREACGFKLESSCAWLKAKGMQ